MLAVLSRPLAARVPADAVPAVNLRRALAGLWLLDGLLQCQPYMFTSKFASNILAPAGSGQPGWVASGVSWSAHLVGGHPITMDAGFALAQLMIGVAIFFPRTARLGLYGSIAWGLGVWYMGEGLGGVASGQGNLLTGSPGAALVYALLAAVLLAYEHSGSLASWFTRGAWLLVWCGGGALVLVGGQYLPGPERALFSQSASAAPAFLSGPVAAVGRSFSAGPGLGMGLAVVEVMIGLLALGPAGVRRAAAGVGMMLALFFWVFGQDLGQLWTGSATDPNCAVPLVVLAFALACCQGTSRNEHATNRQADKSRSGETPAAARRQLEAA